MKKFTNTGSRYYFILILFVINPNHQKRTRINGPIKFHLLREKPMDCSNTNESYICFRRRMDKIQTRRNKQRDQSECVLFFDQMFLIDI